jgi:hypothetical protein
MFGAKAQIAALEKGLDFDAGAMAPGYQGSSECAAAGAPVR